MALGTATAGLIGGPEGGPLIAANLSFLGDSSYPTGGTAAFQAYVQAALGKGAVTLLGVVSGDMGDNYAVYDVAADKLKVFVRSTGAEVANTTDLSSVTFNITVIAK